MKSARSLGTLLALLLLAFTACDDGAGPSGTVIADFAGFLNATRFQFDDATGDHPGFRIDAIDDAGGTMTLDVTETGAFTGGISIPGVTVNPQTGQTVTLTIGGNLSLLGADTLRVDFDAGTEQADLFGDFDATYTLSGDVLTLLAEGGTFDFPDDFEQAWIGTTRGAVAVDLIAHFQR